MRRLFSRRPSPALAVSLVALFVALGGTSYAAIVITSKNIKNGTIRGRDVHKSTLTGRNVKNRSLTASDVKNNTLTSKQIAESKLGTVPSAATANDATQLGGKPASAYGAASRWVLISSTGTILAQSGGFAAPSHVAATGIYTVGVGASAANLPLTATVNYGTPGVAVVAPCGGTANNPGGINCSGINSPTQVIARTYNLAGGLTDRTFYLTIG